MLLFSGARGAMENCISAFPGSAEPDSSVPADRRDPPPPFQLLLCSHDPEWIHPAAEAGVDGIVVEWEEIEEATQQGFLERAEYGRLARLRRVRSCTRGHVICRVNPWCAASPQELSMAIDSGADELLLPKVRRISDVEAALQIIDGRVPLGIVVETPEAIAVAGSLAAMPISRVHIGLNDLAAALGHGHPFLAIIDGTVESILTSFEQPSGFGGLTLPERGSPYPCHLLMGELLRLRCSFSLLRRSFLQDTTPSDAAHALDQIRAALELSARRDRHVIQQESVDFADRVRASIPMA